jgi:type I restriction enzyme S subunit
MVSSTGHGNASLKRLHYQGGKFALGNILCAAFPIDEELMSARFIFEYLTAFKEELLVSKMIGTANVSLTLGKIGEVPIPIVPPAVQRRVGELMTLCDGFEEALERRENARNKLVTASLNGLNSAENEESFHEYSKFCFSHFARLTTRGEHIQALRQTVFNLAARGLLVRQDPKDESAARLLGERQLFPDSEPRRLPSGWAWSSLNLIGETLGGGTPSKANSEFWKGSIPWVSPKDMKVDVITDSQDHISAAAVEQSAVRLIPIGSLLMVVRGMILAHSFPTASTAVPVTINQDMKAIVPFRADLIGFLVLLTKGLKPEVLRLVLRSTHGTCKLLTDDLFSLPIPIPPLAEQHRILAKVDELMAICDRLEAQLKTGQGEASQLLESVLHHALPASRTVTGNVPNVYGVTEASL